MRIILTKSNIVDFEADCIVNAANPTLFGGAGVAGAIFKKASKTINEEIRNIPDVEGQKKGVKAIPGSAIATNSHMNNCKYIIHAVGPIWPGGRKPVYPGEYNIDTTEEAVQLLARCLITSYDLAYRLGCKSIAIPAVSCGLYGGQINDFASIVFAIAKTMKLELDVYVCMYNQEEYDWFKYIWCDFQDGKFHKEVPLNFIDNNN